MKDNKTKLAELISLITKFRDERGWSKFHSPRNLATSIVLESSELLELFQWDLKAISASEIRKNKEKMDEIKKEMADIIAYCLSLADTLEIDVSEAVSEKMIHNAKKYPTKHFNKNGQDHKYYKKIKAKYRVGKKQTFSKG